MLLIKADLFGARKGWEGCIRVVVIMAKVTSSKILMW